MVGRFVHHFQLPLDLAFDGIDVVKVVSKRRMNLGGSKMGIFPANILGLPAVSQVIRNDLRNANPRQAFHSSDAFIINQDVRVFQIGGHIMSIAYPVSYVNRRSSAGQLFSPPSTLFPLRSSLATRT